MKRIFAVILATTATFGVGFGTSQYVAAHDGTQAVPSSEVARLGACDAAVKAAVRYDAARVQGADVETPLAKWWAAKDACGTAGAWTTEAAR